MTEVATQSGAEAAGNPPSTLDEMIAQARQGAEQEAIEAQGLEQPLEESTQAEELATPQDTEQERSESADETDEEKKPIYTRKDAARLAEQLEETKAKQRELEQQIEARKKEDEQIAAEVAEALGTKDAYDKAKATLLDTSKPQRERDQAAELIRTFDANRGFFSKLEKAAFNKITNVVSNDFVKAATELEGVDQKVLFGQSMFEALKHVYEAGQGVKDKEIQRLKTELDGLTKKLAGVGKRTPVSGGNFAGVPVAFDEMFDPKTGAVKDEYAALAKSGGLRE